ncbi:DegT/DnrJ/EryC1/StrS family aminotransferase [Ruficoccus amylovorans]|uniref:DegT/DnrJ/EryC1/StrS family aminotransferase n=1 Tax=Ruficoccus amylovorans TaxID=1804625 RepID=A0A842HEW7_9BACT|nr:DegT/DnrJ/EryC1/StrS family aminotransferase [Ruficoccus amylovorans]MBC2594117.1 DegT/DnrJ/EryC1/StrS family aminotransferase [Ruficoccus amylovorans]
MSQPFVPPLDLQSLLSPHREAIAAAVAEVIDSCHYVLGPKVEAFEEAFAAYSESAHCIGVNSGTSALHLATRLLDIGPGDEVITTPYTFASSAWCASYQGATPVFVDIDPATFCIDPAAVEAAVTPRTKAIVAVHLYGHPCEMDALKAICQKHDLALIEDAAQAHGARYKGKRVGAIGDMGCFSFYPTKNLPCAGEGGALTTDCDKLAARGRSLRNHGSTVRYFHEEVGYNYRMEAIQGAVLGVLLPNLEGWTEARRRLAHRYHELLDGLPLQLPREAEGCESVYHLYTVLAPERDKLIATLKEQGVGTSNHYPRAMHLQPCYADLGYKEGSLPAAERAAREAVNLPMFPTMTLEQQDTVCAALRAYFG